MSQQRQFQMEGLGNSPMAPYNDTTFTKIFVGGLAWETQRDTMRRYFEQFGEIIEAVVITDKNTGRSKGYGFVTFKDPEAAMRACQNPSPVIDGRRANCNLACLGAQKTRPPTPRHAAGIGRFRPGGPGLISPAIRGSTSAFVHQPAGQYTFPFSGYGGFTGYSQEGLYPLNYYSLYGGQPFSPYYSASGAPNMLHSFYPLYPQYAQNSTQAHGFGVQYHPQMIQYPYLPHHQFSSPPPPILSLPASLAMSTGISGAQTTTSSAAAVAATTTSSVAATMASPSKTTSTAVTVSSASQAPATAPGKTQVT